MLTMTRGNINTGSNTLFLASALSGNLSHTEGIITGSLLRAVSTPAGTEYLFPVGTSSSYKPLKIIFSQISPGQLAVRYQPADIGFAGLPLNDAGTEIFDRQPTGYWTLTASGGMASNNYSVNLNYSGFSGVDANARILKRTDGGDLTLDGSHGTVSGQEITRAGMSGISTATTDLAIGKPDPRIITQPSDFYGCTASFSVTVSAKSPVNYKWQENDGGGFSDLSDGGLYSGTSTSTLLISGVTEPMNGNLYRCVITDASGYSITSSEATLTFLLPEVMLGYNYVMDITLDPASGADDLTDFPALISVTNPLLRSTANGGHVYNSNGYDIIFTSLDGSVLFHQIETYDPATGQYIAWVRIPLLALASPTTIKMMYGSPTVSADPSSESVWTSSYKGIWHLNGSDFTDATVYSNDGTQNATTDVTGRIAGGKGFNGSSSYIQVSTNGFVTNDNNQTISIWANYSTAPSGNRNLISFQNTAQASAIQLGFRGGDAVAWKWGGTILANGGASPSTNNWHYYVYTFDGTTSRIFIDGIERGSSTEAPQTAMPSEGNIGRYNPGEYIAASLDEPRFSMSRKSAGWILTEYNNQNDPGSFISMGAESESVDLGSIGVCSSTFLLNQGFPAGGIYSGTGVSGNNFDASVAGVGTHVITYLYTDVNGCSNSAQKNIIVTAVPGAPAVADKECCISNIVDLEASGTNLKWYSDAGLTALAGTGTPFATGQTTAGIHTYYVTQTINGCESTASSISLRVFSAVSVDTQPQPATVCEGDDAQFTVAASGYNLNYQWQEDGINIVNGGIYSGATTATLNLSDPGISNNGKEYLCIITSTCGAPATSSAALLTVTPIPVATFSYPGTPYCPNASNPLPAFSGGGTAGTFSSTAGLVFASTATGEIDITASTPGDYIVTNTISAAGACGLVTATSPFSIISGRTWSGNISSDWNDADNWSCNLLPDITTPIQIPDVPNKPILGAGGTGSVNNLTIDPGSSLTISGNTLRISGVITNNGLLNASAGTIELNGSALQSVEANTFELNAVRNLIVNNPSGANLEGPLKVSGMVTLQNGNLNSGGHLILISDIAGTALINGSGTGNVTGEVSMQRYLPSGFGYKYFSSPFVSATVSEFTDEMITAIYRYDENRLVGGVPASGWVNYNIPTNTLVPLTGYSVNFGSNPATITIENKGIVNNGPVSRTLYNNDQIFTRGFNLAGNPYPSPIDWDIAKLSNINIDDAVYYFRASTTDQYGGSYSAYVNEISSDGSATNVIPSMQGFFVHVSNGLFPVTGTINIDNTARITDQTHSFIKSGGKNYNSLIRMSASYSNDSVSSDHLTIYLNDKATPDFDSQLDALKIFNTDNRYPNFYSIANDGSKLSINAIPPPDTEPGSIPLTLKTGKSGDVSIKIRQANGLFSTLRVYLFDSLTGISTEMYSDNEYRIFLGAGDHTNRFFIQFTNTGTGIQDQFNNDFMFTVYSSGGMLKAQIEGIIEEEGTLEINNLTGQKLYSYKVYEDGYHEFSSSLKSGIFIVSFSSGNKRISRKIFIRNQ